MYADQKALLDQAITAVNNWRTAAAALNVELNQVNFKFPNNQSIVFVWDAEVGQFKIDT
jgi:hypothetical protein